MARRTLESPNSPPPFSLAPVLSRTYCSKPFPLARPCHATPCHAHAMPSAVSLLPCGSVADGPCELLWSLRPFQTLRLPLPERTTDSPIASSETHPICPPRDATPAHSSRPDYCSFNALTASIYYPHVPCIACVCTCGRACVRFGCGEIRWSCCAVGWIHHPDIPNALLDPSQPPSDFSRLAIDTPDISLLSPIMHLLGRPSD